MAPIMKAKGPVITPPARIFRSDFRASKIKRSQSHEKATLLPGSLNDSFSSLRVLKETTLGPGCRQYYRPDYDMLLVLIPLVGDLEVGGRHLGVGESILMYFPQYAEFEIYNPHASLPNHFLHIDLSIGIPTNDHLARFSANQIKNRLQLMHWIPIPPSGHWRTMLGKFTGRAKYLYQPQENVNIFAYVVEGAFELQECLLEKSDGLAISEVDLLEFEALSSDAILMIVEELNNEQ